MSRSFRNRSVLSAITAGLLLAASAALAFIVQTIPVHISTTAHAVTGGAGFSCTVTVREAPGEDSVVMVNTSRPDILASPSGSWPYALAIPEGSTSGSLSVHTSTVRSTESASLTSYSAQTDSSRPNAATVATSVLVNP